ncbi:Signal peptidase I [Lentibacillus sp. JNUCC-1]|uniref:signal peptidase I n=1 Tax=Lentibacillus sp. JNUCC-1 TaxID=2654513 RepID=UPI001321A417|nr:Signal peptidase I [Lentibacillus sp. JNUCC-1]
MTETNKKKKSEWLEWAKAILIAIVIGLLLQNFVMATSVVEGESMDPTLEDGERVIFNKFIYLIDSPERGDIVIIQHPSKNYVKRVIGLPGETIEMQNHILYIDDQEVAQDFIGNEAINSTGNFGPIHIPEDSYFVMGDNRAKSRDSRNGLGLIKEEDIIGRSELIYYPFDQWGLTR